MMQKARCRTIPRRRLSFLHQAPRRRRPRRDPLELLSRSRLPGFLAEASKHFRVVVIDTPAAARGPDFQMFAALAGGALVVTAQDSAEAQALRGLHATLQRCAARLVATVARRD